jgi:hypothetical protein
VAVDRSSNSGRVIALALVAPHRARAATPPEEGQQGEHGPSAPPPRVGPPPAPPPPALLLPPLPLAPPPPLPLPLPLPEPVVAPARRFKGPLAARRALSRALGALLSETRAVALNASARHGPDLDNMGRGIQLNEDAISWHKQPVVCT